MKAFHFDLDGFSDTVHSTDEIQARVADLKRSYPSLIGKPCSIHTGERFRDGSGYYFPPQTPTVIVVGA